MQYPRHYVCLMQQLCVLGVLQQLLQKLHFNLTLSPLWIFQKKKKKKDVKSKSCYKSELRHQINLVLRDEAVACVEIISLLHGKRVYVVNLRTLIIPLGSFVYFQIPSFVGLELGQCLCLLWPRGKSFEM